MLTEIFLFGNETSGEWENDVASLCRTGAGVRAMRVTAMESRKGSIIIKLKRKMSSLFFCYNNLDCSCMALLGRMVET
jgi:hypothetical protein